MGKPNALSAAGSTFLLMTSHPSGDASFSAAMADMHQSLDRLDEVDWRALSPEALIDTVRRMTVVRQQLQVVRESMQREVVKRTLRTANPPYAEVTKSAARNEHSGGSLCTRNVGDGVHAEPANEEA